MKKIATPHFDFESKKIYQVRMSSSAASTNHCLQDLSMPVVWMASEAGMARTMQTMTQTKEKKCFS